MDDSNIPELVEQIKDINPGGEDFEFPEGIYRGSDHIFDLIDALVPHLAEDAETNGGPSLHPDVREFLLDHFDPIEAKALERITVLSHQLAAEPESKRGANIDKWLVAAADLHGLLEPRPEVHFPEDEFFID